MASPARSTTFRTAPQSRGLYTYLITPVGVIARLSTPGDADELRFKGRLSKKDGWSKEQNILVRSSPERPNLVDDVVQILGRGAASRMVVRFERVAVEQADGVQVMRTYAVVEDILEPARAPLAVQLSLFE